MPRHYESWEDGIRMINISINLFPHQIRFLEKVVASGYFSGRSVLIRKLIDQYLAGYFKMLKAMDLLTPEQIKIMGE